MTRSKRENFSLILILGSLTALSPFSIDMYLPAFPQIAMDFKTTVSQVALSLSSYFIGLAFGQLIYGPFLDRYGRKKPLYIGLMIYIITSLACLTTGSISSLVFLRLLQALGACVASVATMSMVRDLFPPQESAKVYSLLILILGVSPLLAPTAGGYLTVYFGWHSVFIALAAIGALLLATVYFALPESHRPDSSIQLKPGPIARNFYKILRDPVFYTYCFSATVAFSGLFSYLAGSPVVFMDIFQTSPQTYSWIFAAIAAGLIIASQLNAALLKKYRNHQILRVGFMAQTITGFVFVIGTALGWMGLTSTIITFFVFLSCMGFINANAASLALAPFGKNAGSASALLGFSQMAMGALSSMVVGVVLSDSVLPIAIIITSTTCIAFAILMYGTSRIKKQHHPLATATTGAPPAAEL